MKQLLWEIALEHALCEATPEQVLEIMHKIEGWLLGFCTVCGKYTDLGGGLKGCEHIDYGN